MTAGPYTAAEDALILANVGLTSASLRAFLPTRTAESIRRRKTTLKRKLDIAPEQGKQPRERIMAPYASPDFSPGWGAYRAQRATA